MDETILMLWGVIGTWVAGLSTVSAVVVSLWLALRQDKVRLRVVAEWAMRTPEFTHCIHLEVHNIGVKKAEICSIQYRIKGCKLVGHQCDGFLSGSDNISKEIAEGDSARYLIPFYEEKGKPHLLQTINEMSEGRDMEKCIKRLRVEIGIRSGMKFSAPLGKHAKFLILDAYRKQSD